MVVFIVGFVLICHPESARWFIFEDPLPCSCGFLVIRSFFVIVRGSRDGSSLLWWSSLGKYIIFSDYMQLEVVFDGQRLLVRNES